MRGLVMSELEFGRKLRALRHERSETLEDVSTATGLSVAMLSRVERGQRLPSPESVEALAQHFGLPTEDLMRETIASRIVNSYGREWTGTVAEEAPADMLLASRAESRQAAPTPGAEPAHPAPDACRMEFADSLRPRSAGVRTTPSRPAGTVFSVRPVEELFEEDAARDSLADSVRVAEVALESAMRAVRRAQASGDPRQVAEAERVLERLREMIG
jgi:transcriptional regulator with XRE-family HTH domain